MIINKRLKKEFEDIKKENEALTNEMQLSSTQVSAVSRELALTLEDNNVFSQRLFKQTESMTSLNNEVNVKISETVSSVRDVMSILGVIASTSHELGRLNKNAEGTVQCSLRSIADILENINDIKDTSKIILNYMDKLHRLSTEIEDILGTVSNIARQTHLLALNASIESAKAGDAGRGFAVVSKEIGKLSKNTTNAVKSISDLISVTKSDIGGMNDIVDENTRRVEKGVEASASIGKDLKNIMDSFALIGKSVDKITAASEKEAQMTDRINANILEMEKAIGLTADSVQIVFQSALEQKESMEGIMDLGNRLRSAAEIIERLTPGKKRGSNNTAHIDGELIKDRLESFRLILNGLEKSNVFGSLDSYIYSNIFMKIMRENTFIEAIWTNDRRGRFICSIPEAGIANAGIREWFNRSISGEEYVSGIYISAITRNPCLTISAPVMGKDGGIRGVFGLDVKL